MRRKVWPWSSSLQRDSARRWEFDNGAEGDAFLCSGTWDTGGPYSIHSQVSSQDGQYPQELTHDQLKQRINYAISRSEHPDLKIQAVQKYKTSLGVQKYKSSLEIIVADSVARNSLPAARALTGTEAFNTFDSASAPKERYQILVYHIPANQSWKKFK
ncbi:hypothetical protein R1flu_027496 [Riccia fluitans]|uniref:Uncharacterized protein n=1 Tax=Riccia fluitans TaxID=41844 RepID=A0ABD1XN07_9MARC